MYHRRHRYLSTADAAAEDGVVIQKVDDDRPHKRRKLDSDLVGILEEPKVGGVTIPSLTSEAHSSTSRQSLSPLPGTSHHNASRPRRSPLIRRHRSLPEQGSAANLAVSSVDSVDQSVVAGSSRLLRSSTSHSPHASLPSVLTSVPAADPVQYLTQPPTPAAYLMLPTTTHAMPPAVGHYFAVPTCVPTVPVAHPYLMSRSRPCPTTWMPFTTLGPLVPAPVLSSLDMTTFYGFPMSHTPFPPQSVAFSTPSAPPSVIRSVPINIPGSIRQPDFTVPSSHPPPPPYPAHRASLPSRGPYGSDFTAPTSHRFFADNATQPDVRQHYPSSSLYPPPYSRSSDSNHRWTPTTQPSTHTTPAFLHQFLAMLENTLTASHDSASGPLSYPPHNFHNYEALLGLARQLGEPKPKGMSKADIDRLPLYPYSVMAVESKRCESSTQTSCVVCMCDFASRQRVRELPCQHIFHAKCVDKWLKTNRTCPLCRADALEIINTDEKCISADD